MVKNIHIPLKVVISLFVGLIIAGCASDTKRIPLYISSEPEVISSIEAITMLPVADLRKDKSSDKSDEVYKQLALELAVKGYVLQMSDQFSADRKVHPEEIKEMAIENIAKLGPKGNDYILICFLEDIHSSNAIIISTAQVKASAVLIDKKNKRYLWKDRATASAGKFGLLVSIIPMDSWAIMKVFKELISSLPDKV